MGEGYFFKRQRESFIVRIIRGLYLSSCCDYYYYFIILKIFPTYWLGFLKCLFFSIWKLNIFHKNL